MYCSPIWGIDQIKKLSVFQNKFLKRLFGLPNCTPNWFTRLEASVHSIEAYFIRSLLNLRGRVITSKSTSLVKNYL
jgi:hypothetical protein